MRRPIHRVFIFHLVIFFACGALFADGLEDVSFQVIPGLEIPFGEKSGVFTEDAMYTLGGSASVRGQYIFPGLPFLFMDGRFSYAIQPTQAAFLSLIT